MSKTALITGVSGQDGAYLARLLLDNGYRVIGTTRRPDVCPDRLRMLGIEDRVTLAPAPTGSTEAFRNLISAVAPDEIYNLAAQSSLTHAAIKPVESCESTAMDALYLFEAVRLVAPGTRVFQASSAQVFGTAAAGRHGPQGPFAPANLYGAGKLFAQLAGQAYRQSYGLFISCGILYAHESRLRSAEFITRKVTSTLAAIRCGQADLLEVGNLNSERDWGYSPDFVRGMWLSLGTEAAGTYVFATGVVHTVRDLIGIAGTCFGFNLEWCGSGVDEIGVDRATGRKIVAVNPAFYRPFEERTPLADISSTTSRLGWIPSTTFREIIAEMCQADLFAAERAPANS